MTVAAARLAAPTRPVDAVVFDCDGVLVDSERLLVTIHQRVFRELGWE